MAAKEVNTYLPLALSTSTSADDSLPEETASPNGVNVRLCSPVVSYISKYVGSLITLTAIVIMSLADTCIEIGTDLYHPFQVTFIFASAMFATSLTCSIVSGQARNIGKVKEAWVYLLLCGITNCTGLTFINASINLMPVGDAITILRCMPIFAGVFGWIWLNQKLGILDLLFTLCCIVGVTLIARPSFMFPNEDGLQTPSLVGVTLALGSAVMFALSFVLGVKLSDNEVHPFITISVNAVCTVVLNGTLVLIFSCWTTLDSGYHIVAMVVGGICQAIGQILVFIALSKERTVVVTVILAFEIVIIYVLQIVIIRIIPHWLSGVAALLILFSCVGITISKVE